MGDGTQNRTYIIGRAGDIRLEHTSASRHHARLTVTGDTVTLHDLDSRNGTFRIDGFEAVPFAGGEVFLDEVFAFSVCIRSVREMIEEVGEAGDWPASGKLGAALQRTQESVHSASRPRLADPIAEARIAKVSAKISKLLRAAFAEFDESAQRRAFVPDVGSHGNTDKSDKSREHEQSITALQHEVYALREMLVSVCRERDAVQRISELSLERIELQESLISRLDASKAAVDMNSTAELPQFEEPETRLESPDEHVDLDRRYFLSTSG